MIKCNVNKEKDHIKVKIEGTAHTINIELMALIKGVYRGIKSGNEHAAEVFREVLIAALLDPASPIWEED